MSYARATGHLTVGYPHYDGYPLTIGAGRDWPASEPREDTLRGFTPDVGGSYGWMYGGRFEYLDKLHCIAPIGTYTEADMALSAWTVLSGKWRLSAAAGPNRYKCLHYYEGRAGYSGEVRSAANMVPNLQCEFWRMPRGYGETGQAVLDIHFYNGGQTQYILRFPAEGAAGTEQTDLTGETDPQYTAPMLLGKPAGDGRWTVVDKLSLSSTPRLGQVGNTALHQTVRIEYLASTPGVLLVRLNDSESCWAFSGQWESIDGTTETFALADSGQVGIRLYNHTAMFRLYQLSYPTNAVLRPAARFITGDAISTDRQARVVAAQPTGTGITVAFDVDAVTGSRPEATFTNGTKRAALYNIQEYRPGTTGNADTTVYYSGLDNADFVATELSGRISDTWRGSTCRAIYRSLTPGDIQVVAPNSKVTAAVNLTDGAEANTTMFVGYTGAPSKAREAGPNWVEGELECADYIEARLSHKPMSWHCSYSGWPIADAFRQILSQAGVPSALISVDALCEGITIPEPTMLGERRWHFSPESDVIGALDSLVASVGIASTAYTAPEKRGMTWGVNQAGLVRLAPAYEHVAGTYLKGSAARDSTDPDDVGWPITEGDVDIEDMIVPPVMTSRDLSQFANMLTLMAGSGVDAQARMYYDAASWSTPGSAAFIGDIWARFESAPDGGDLDAIFWPMWRSLYAGHRHISFSMHDRPTILPEDELYLTINHVDITAGTIARVLSKDWSISGFTYTQRIEAVIVEDG